LKLLLIIIIIIIYHLSYTLAFNKHVIGTAVDLKLLLYLSYEMKPMLWHCMYPAEQILAWQEEFSSLVVSEDVPR
jgi:hypothetical protein